MSLPDHRRRSSLLFCPRAPVQSTGESRKAVTGGAPAVTGGGAEVVTFAAASLALGYIRSRSVQNKCHGNMAVILHAMQNWRKQKQTALTGQKLLNGPDWLETLPKPKEGTKLSTLSNAHTEAHLRGTSTATGRSSVARMRRSTASRPGWLFRKRLTIVSGFGGLDSFGWSLQLVEVISLWKESQIMLETAGC